MPFWQIVMKFNIIYARGVYFDFIYAAIGWSISTSPFIDNTVCLFSFVHFVNVDNKIIDYYIYALKSRFRFSKISYSNAKQKRIICQNHNKITDVFFLSLTFTSVKLAAGFHILKLNFLPSVQWCTIKTIKCKKSFILIKYAFEMLWLIHFFDFDKIISSNLFQLQRDSLIQPNDSCMPFTLWSVCKMLRQLHNKIKSEACMWHGPNLTCLMYTCRNAFATILFTQREEMICSYPTIFYTSYSMDFQVKQ